MSKILKIIVFTLTFACTCLAFSDDKKKDDFWLPMEERVKIWDAVVSEQLSLSLPLSAPKPYNVSYNGLEATFEKDGLKWTIVGANAPIVNPTVYPKDWPVKGTDFEVLVIPEPITNYKILPFTEKIENAVKSDTISITAAPASYEPASFVIRSGDVDLKNVKIKVADLKAEIKGKDGKKKTVIIPKEDIDVRVVKCWYQAGVAMNDTKHKLLTPELLLHDDDIVKIDYERQVNLLKDFEKMQDSESLHIFDISKRQNKQIWITVYVNKEIYRGKYSGNLRIVTNGHAKKELALLVEVLPYILPKPMLTYALFYDGFLSKEKGQDMRGFAKSKDQMLFELLDMQAHGLSNATVLHQVDSSARNREDISWKMLKDTIVLRNKIGWGGAPLLYLDWKMTMRENLDGYKRKIKKIVSIAKLLGINDVYIYGADEKRGKDLLDLKEIYLVVHEAGAKTFVACKEDFIDYIPGLIDLPLLPGDKHDSFLKTLSKLGMKVWNYANPQSGIEYPETYRNNYGVKLLSSGFLGVCNYHYHSAGWNDFKGKVYRLHSMVYPTISKPIPTIQWEGWRAGVNDVRYITLGKDIGLIDNIWIDNYCFDGSTCRKHMIKAMVNCKK